MAVPRSKDITGSRNPACASARFGIIKDTVKDTVKGTVGDIIQITIQNPNSAYPDMGGDIVDIEPPPEFTDDDPYSLINERVRLQ